MHLGLAKMFFFKATLKIRKLGQGKIILEVFSYVLFNLYLGQAWSPYLIVFLCYNLDKQYFSNDDWPWDSK